jgi:8-oxo-dGTP diphosphatase
MGLSGIRFQHPLTIAEVTRALPHASGIAPANLVRDGDTSPGTPRRSVLVRAPQRLAAYALIVDPTGQVLLARQPDGRGRLGPWILPGGGVEHGEHPEQAVIREVREETGLPVQVGALQDVISELTTVGRRRRVLHNVRLIYLATVLSPDPEGGRLSANARWLDPPGWRELPLAPFTARALSSTAQRPGD